MKMKMKNKRENENEQSLPSTILTVQEFACLLVINFRVYYPRNFIFGFPVNYNWSRGWLCPLGESIKHSRFEHGHMENWMNNSIPD